MYSGEATVTNDQLEGVLKAGDILRVRGLWRSNSGSKKENIQSNNQKLDRDKREQQPVPGQIQKIKLVQPTTEKVVETSVPASQPTPLPAQTPPMSMQKLPERKNSTTDKIEDARPRLDTPEPKKIIEENKSNDETKNKENVESNGKKRRANNSGSEAESNKSSKSDGGDNNVSDRYINYEISIN